MRSLSTIIMNKIHENYGVSFYKTGTDDSGKLIYYDLSEKIFLKKKNIVRA